MRGDLLRLHFIRVFGAFLLDFGHAGIQRFVAPHPNKIMAQRVRVMRGGELFRRDGTRPGQKILHVAGVGEGDSQRRQQKNRAGEQQIAISALNMRPDDIIPHGKSPSEAKRTGAMR